MRIKEIEYNSNRLLTCLILLSLIKYGFVITRALTKINVHLQPLIPPPPDEDRSLKIVYSIITQLRRLYK